MYNKKGFFDLLDLFSIVALFIVSTTYLYVVMFSNMGDFLGSEEVIGSVQTPSNVEYALAILNSPSEEGLRTADFISEDFKEGDFSGLNIFMGELFEETDLHWYVSVHSSKDYDDALVVYQRKDWKFEEGFDSYVDYVYPNYFGDDLIKVTMAVDEGVWIPQEKYENAPGRAIGGVV